MTSSTGCLASPVFKFVCKYHSLEKVVENLNLLKIQTYPNLLHFGGVGLSNKK